MAMSVFSLIGLPAHALYSEFVIDMKIPAQRIQRLHIAIFQKRVDRQKGKVLPACVCGDKFVYCRFRQAGFFLNIGCGSCFAVIVTEQIADFAAEQVAHTQQFGKGRQSDAVFPLGYRLPRTNVYFFCKTILCQVELFPLCPYPFADFLGCAFRMSHMKCYTKLTHLRFIKNKWLNMHLPINIL